MVITHIVKQIYITFVTHSMAADVKKALYDESGRSVTLQVWSAWPFRRCWSYSREGLFTLITFDKPIAFFKKRASGPVLGRVQLLIKFGAYFNNPSHESPAGHNSWKSHSHCSGFVTLWNGESEISWQPPSCINTKSAVAQSMTHYFQSKNKSIPN